MLVFFASINLIKVFPSLHFLHRWLSNRCPWNRLVGYDDSNLIGHRRQCQYHRPHHSNVQILLCDARVTSATETDYHSRCICIRHFGKNMSFTLFYYIMVFCSLISGIYEYMYRVDRGCIYVCLFFMNIWRYTVCVLLRQVQRYV